MSDPIAYTYEADTHCPVCAEKRFGICKEHKQIACCVEDNGGNEPGAMAPWNETCAHCGVYCGTCGTEIRAADPEVEECL